ADIPFLRLSIHAPSDLKRVGMGAKPCRDFVRLCVGFDVVSKFKPAEGGFQVKNIRWPQWFHFTKPAFDGTCITKAPTPGSFDARDRSTQSSRSGSPRLASPDKPLPWHSVRPSLVGLPKRACRGFRSLPGLGKGHITTPLGAVKVSSTILPVLRVCAGSK